MRLEYKGEGTENNNTASKSEEHVLEQGQTVNKQMKLQRDKMKDKPFKEKLSYYVTYYKWYVIVTIGLIALITSIIVSVKNHKDYCFFAMFVNASNMYDNSLAEDFAEYAGLDTDNYECYIDTTSTLGTDIGYYEDSATLAKFVANIQSKELDCAIFNSFRFETDAMNLTYIDLATILPKDYMEKYKDKLYYIDYSEYLKLQEEDPLVDLNKEPKKDTDLSLEEQYEALAYHMNPDKMKEPIAVGIVIDDAPFIANNYIYPATIPVFGIIGNTTRPELAIKFLDFLYL